MSEPSLIRVKPCLDSVAESSRGVALLMVLLVLAALVIIGTPFVVSMKIQEQGSAHHAASERARLAQFSVRNHAVAELYKTHPQRESGEFEVAAGNRERAARYSDIVVPNGKVDEYEELDIEVKSQLPIQSLGGEETNENYVLQDVKQRVSDVAVEDEQGKINLNSASPTMLGSLFGASHLSKTIGYDDNLTELPLESTEPFIVDNNGETIDGVVVIFNPGLFTMEAVSYTGKTDTHLTGCFRGAYMSGTWPQQVGFPVFDLRGIKLYLHRIYDLSDNELRTYRTTQGVREIADWSMVPYFLKTLALVGLNLRNMDEYGLTPAMLARAGFDKLLLDRKDDAPVDEGEHRRARDAITKLGVPSEAIDLLEQARGKAAVIEIAKYAKDAGVERAQGQLFSAFFESTIKKELTKLRSHSQKYFPKAIESFKFLYDQPGLETITARNYEDIRHLITTTSSIPEEWSEEQLVLGNVENNPLLGLPVLPVAHMDWFNAGTVVRIRSLKDPAKSEYSVVGAGLPTRGGGVRSRSTTPGPFGRGGIILREPLKHKYTEQEAVISARLRHPININTAAIPVLVAVFTGLRSFAAVTAPPDRDPPRVTATEARRLAAFLRENLPIAGFDHFRRLIEEAAGAKLIDDEDLPVVLLNAINSNHPSLGVSTTSFCYTSGNVYTIESAGMVNASSGLELAAARVREIIEVSPPELLTHRIQSQDDWVFRLFHGSNVQSLYDPDRWNNTTVSSYLAGREGNLMITGPEVLQQGIRVKGPHQFQGSLKALTTQIKANQQQHNGFAASTFGPVEHFDATLEGLELSALEGHRVATIQQAPQGGFGAGNPTTQVEDLITLPGSLEFWMRPRWGVRTADRTFFDTLADPSQPTRNRILMYFDAAQQEIVFRIMDDTYMPPGLAPISVVSGAEIRHPITPQTFADDTWYHIRATWGSTTPGDQRLMIDHRPVGRDMWTTSLAARLPAIGMKFTLRDADVADRYPRTGALMIGGEVVEYERRDGTTFEVRQADPMKGTPAGRGARGSTRQEHPAKTPVRLFGYSSDLMHSDPTVTTVFDPLGNVTPYDLGDVMLVGNGGARTKHLVRATQVWDRINLRLQKTNFARLQAQDPTAPPGSIASFVPYMVQPGDSAIRVAVDVLQADPATLGFPIEGGYLQLVSYQQTPLSGFTVLHVWQHFEYVKYAGLRPVPGSAGLVYEFFGLGRRMLGTTSATNLIVDGPVRGTTVYAVSIETASSDLDLHYPSSGVVQLDRSFVPNASATGTQPGVPLPEVEWIYYARIAEGRFFIADPFNNRRMFRGFSGETSFYRDPDDWTSFGRARFDPNSVMDHPEDQEVFPVLRVASPTIGVDDYVFIGDSHGPSQFRAFEPQPNRVRIARPFGSGVYASFYRQFTNPYFVRGNPKIKMFPSGELPVRSSQAIIVGATAGAAPGGPLEATVDEIRLSRARFTDVDYFPFPFANGRLTRDVAPQPPGAQDSFERKLLRTYYDDGASVDASGVIDKFLLLGRGRINAYEGNGAIWRQLDPGYPRSFGLGKDQGLCSIGGELLHYSFQPGAVEDLATVRILQELPSDLAFLYEQPDVDGNWPVRNVYRDLRTEVWPEIRVNILQGTLPPRDGFIEITTSELKEVIYYEIFTGTALRNCLRGQLGTQVGSYAFTTYQFNRQGGYTVTENLILARVLPRREVDLLRRQFLGTTAPEIVNLTQSPILPLAELAVTTSVGTLTDAMLQVESVRDFPTGAGYLLRDLGVGAATGLSPVEILGYTAKEGDNFFARARDDRTGSGLFRERYGTVGDTDLVAGETLVEFPVRYHDHYQPRVESTDLMYWQRTIRVPGAHWERVRWQAEEMRNRTFDTEVRVVARLDGVPDWDAEPTNKPGGLYLFTESDGRNEIQQSGETLELRIYYRYLPGSYGQNAAVAGGGWNDSWKHAPTLTSLEIDYRKPWRVLHREDLPH
ncbi:MAG: hypothetical protein ACKVX7_01830 [Planctomycetota bacterium]